MAGTESKATYSIKLTTPEVPRQEGLPLDFQIELMGIYQAIRNLASLVDRFTGQQITPPGEEPDTAEDIRNTFIVERFSYIYLPFNMNAKYGDLIGIATNGTAVFPTGSSGSPNQIDSIQPIGYVAEEIVDAGTYGKVAIRGVLRVSGGVPGQWLTWYYPEANGQFLLASGTGVSSAAPVIAKVLTDKYIWFTGVTWRHRP